MEQVTSSTQSTADGACRTRPLRHLAPVAVPISRADLAAGFRALRHPNQALHDFRALIQTATSAAYCGLTASGRAALTLILLGLKTSTETHALTSVIVPAYGCPTTVQSVLAAGLTPVFCDVDPETLDLDRTALHRLVETSGARIIIATHLYGLAQDVRDLRQMPVVVVEDAAQAFGAQLDGRMVGTWGDAGLYSLGRGKCLPAGHGGIIVAQAHIAEAIARVTSQRMTLDARHRTIAGLIGLTAYAVYGLATHPRGWWWVTRSPLNPAEAGMDINSLPTIRFKGLSPVSAGLGASILARVRTTVSIRRHNANRLMALVGDTPAVTAPHIPEGAEPAYLRMPLVAISATLRDRLYDDLYAHGIGVSRSYTRTLPDLYAHRLGSDEAAFPGARRLAQCLLTLPTHSYVDDTDFGIMSRIFAHLRSHS